MKIRTGVLLAAGSGTRLAPLTTVTNKHMLPVYNKFMIEYPLNSLRALGCEQITIVIGGDQTGFGQVVSFLRDGSDFGVKINYVYQPKAEGIAHAINLCSDYIKDDKFAVILGDNVFESSINFTNPKSGAQVVLCQHPELHRFGVASIREGKLVKVEEKPKNIDTSYDNFAITGLYLFNQKYFEYYKNLKRSARGEYEITDIIEQYRKDNDLHYVVSEGWWSDTGTFDSILKVSRRIRDALLAEKP